MPLNRHAAVLDLTFTNAGDFALDSSTGDLGDTQDVQYAGTIQIINDRLMSSGLDWVLHQGKGAGLDRFLGLPNTPETGELIRRAVLSELTYGGFLTSSDFEVDVVPLGRHSVGIVLVLSPAGASRSIVLTFSYDMRENRVIPRNV